MNDFEPSLLYSIAITALILGTIAIVWVIIGINVSNDDINPPTECQESCSTLLNLDKSPCQLNDSLTSCTTDIAVDISDSSGYFLGTFLTSSVSTSYAEVCAGTCNGTTSRDDDGNYSCSDPNCSNMDCTYNRCIDYFKPLPECKDEYSKPIGCRHNIPFYPKVLDKNVNAGCVCSF